MDTKVKTIEIEDGVNGYVDLVNHVLKHGEKTSPRGMETREIEDAVIHIDNIYNTMPIGVGRQAVPGIGAVEAMQLLSGTSFPNLVIAIGPQFAKYTESNGQFHGSYGTRTNGQFDVAISRLQSDSDTRQAVVTMWHAALDSQLGKRDYPCTVLHQYRIRNNKLNLSVYMRSNDVWLGAAYDFFQFTRAQLAVASVLGIEPGTYAHHVGSLHIYSDHYELAENLKHTENIKPTPYITGRSWREVQASSLLTMQAIANTKLMPRLNESEQWYTNAMITAIKKNAEYAKKEDK